MTPLTITYRQGRHAGASRDSLDALGEHLGGWETWGEESPIPLTTVLDVLGIDDCLRALAAVDHRRLIVRFAFDCAERVLPARPEHMSDREYKERSVPSRVGRGLASRAEIEEAKARVAEEAEEAEAWARARVAEAVQAVQTEEPSSLHWEGGWTPEAARVRGGWRWPRLGGWTPPVRRVWWAKVAEAVRVWAEMEHEAAGARVAAAGAEAHEVTAWAWVTAWARVAVAEEADEAERAWQLAHLRALLGGES